MHRTLALALPLALLSLSSTAGAAANLRGIWNDWLIYENNEDPLLRGEPDYDRTLAEMAAISTYQPVLALPVTTSDDLARLDMFLQRNVITASAVKFIAVHDSPLDADCATSPWSYYDTTGCHIDFHWWMQDMVALSDSYYHVATGGSDLIAASISDFKENLCDYPGDTSCWLPADVAGFAGYAAGALAPNFGFLPEMGIDQAPRYFLNGYTLGFAPTASLAVGTHSRASITIPSSFTLWEKSQLNAGTKSLLLNFRRTDSNWADTADYEAKIVVLNAATTTPVCSLSSPITGPELRVDTTYDLWNSCLKTLGAIPASIRIDIRFEVTTATAAFRDMFIYDIVIDYLGNKTLYPQSAWNRVAGASGGYAITNTAYKLNAAVDGVMAIVPVDDYNSTGNVFVGHELHVEGCYKHLYNALNPAGLKLWAVQRGPSHSQTGWNYVDATSYDLINQYMATWSHGFLVHQAPLALQHTERGLFSEIEPDHATFGALKAYSLYGMPSMHGWYQSFFWDTTTSGYDVISSVYVQDYVSGEDVFDIIVTVGGVEHVRLESTLNDETGGVTIPSGLGVATGHAGDTWIKLDFVDTASSYYYTSGGVAGLPASQPIELTMKRVRGLGKSYGAVTFIPICRTGSVDTLCPLNAPMTPGAAGWGFEAGVSITAAELTDAGVSTTYTDYVQDLWADLLANVF